MTSTPGTLRAVRTHAALVSVIVALFACRRRSLQVSPDEATSSKGSHSAAPRWCPPGTVMVPGGSYATNGKPQETVQVTDLCFDVSEVTVDAFAKCVAAGACKEPFAYDPAAGEAAIFMRESCNWKHPEGRLAHPVNCVTWQHATDYCAFVGGRLPTDTEWEWAARGGARASPYPWGDSVPDAPLVNACGSECIAAAVAKYGANATADETPLYPTSDGFPETAPAGTFPKGDNPWGMHDLAGNVSEWTATVEKEHWSQPQYLHGDTAGSRGGGWGARDRPDVASFSRTREMPSRWYPDLGLRCIRDP